MRVKWENLEAENIQNKLILKSKRLILCDSYALKQCYSNKLDSGSSKCYKNIIDLQC